MSSRIKHDITNRLLTLGLIASSLEKALPEILEGHKKACEHSLIETHLSEKMLNYIRIGTADFCKEIEELKKLMNNLQSQ